MDILQLKIARSERPYAMQNMQNVKKEKEQPGETVQR